jgi:Putative serine dehydratase domain
LRRVAETQQQLLQDQRPQAVRLEIGGMLLHSGHSYNVRRSDDDDDDDDDDTNNFAAAAAAADVRAQTLDDIHQDALQKVHRVLHQQLCHEFPDLEYSMGDTPCCSQIAFEDERLGATATKATGKAYCYGDDKQQVVTEIRPGNFVFYDVMQYYIGCIPSLQHIAVCLACPVVAKHVERHEIVVFAGAVHLSKDSIAIETESVPTAALDAGKKTTASSNNNNSNHVVSCWGLVVSLDPVTGTWSNNDGSSVWKNAWVSKLSQEHGIIYTSSLEQLERVNIGDWIGILPIHSCLTAAIMGEYLDIRTRQRVDSMRSRRI